MNNFVDEEPPYVHERSIFHTQEPRDTKTKVHLVLVLLCFATSFVIAIIFAETGGRPLKEAHYQRYGKSE